MKRIFTAVRLTASLTLTGAALLGFALQAQATPTLYVAEGHFGVMSGNLYIMDPTTGLKTQTIGPIGFRVTGMAFDPTTGLLYGSTNNFSPNNPASIIRIDPTTGAGTLIGATGAGAMTDLAFDKNGTLYGWSSRKAGVPNPSNLHTINLSTGSATVVGNFGFQTSGNGLAFSDTGTLYLDPRFGGACPGGPGTCLRTIDPNTGLAIGTVTKNLVLPSGDQFFNSFAFDPDTGLLFGISREDFSTIPFTVWNLGSVDPLTGVVNIIGPHNSCSGCDAVAIAVVLDSDGDGDGVNDDNDLCPDTASGDPVDANGCSFDHFLCYGAKTSKICSVGSPSNAGGSCKKEEDCGGVKHDKFCVKDEFAKVSVALDDQFEAGSFKVEKPDRLCTPADKNGERISDEITHLEGYKIKEKQITENKPPFDTCAECKGGVSSLTLKYLGASTVNIEVDSDDGVSQNLFLSVEQNEVLTFGGLGKDGRLGKTTTITVGMSATELHTSCSQPVGPGFIFGDFGVVAGASAKGGPDMCPVIQVDNQLETVFLNVKDPKRLLIPTAKDFMGPALLDVNNAVDHFKCYDIKAPKDGEVFQVSITDQFHQGRIFDVEKPDRLCTPADKNGEGIKNPDNDLLCYKVKLVPGFCSAVSDFEGQVCKKEKDCGGTKGVTSFCELQPKDEKVLAINLNNQFGDERVDIDKVKELCVPSMKTIFQP